jgi:Uma2 family endonuclease
MSVNLLESKIIKLTKISRDDYALLCRENPEHYKKTELLEGVIVDKMTKSNLHDYYSQIFFDEIQKFLPKGYILRTEKGINFNDSELEPDISIVKGKVQDYKNNKPSTATLIIEISVSSLMYDREKVKAYAKGSVDEYWIVDVSSKCVEVYKQPEEDSYTQKQIYTEEGEIPLFGKVLSLKQIFSE